MTSVSVAGFCGGKRFDGLCCCFWDQRRSQKAPSRFYEEDEPERTVWSSKTTTLSIQSIALLIHKNRTELTHVIYVL